MIYKFQKKKKKKENLLRITRNYARFADIQIAKEDERFSIDLFSLIERNGPIVYFLVLSAPMN